MGPARRPYCPSTLTPLSIRVPCSKQVVYLLDGKKSNTPFLHGCGSVRHCALSPHQTLRGHRCCICNSPGLGAGCCAACGGAGRARMTPCTPCNCSGGHEPQTASFAAHSFSTVAYSCPVASKTKAFAANHSPPTDAGMGDGFVHVCHSFSHPSHVGYICGPRNIYPGEVIHGNV